MKTKSEIIQKLLDKKQIKIEEAMILMEKERELVYVPQYPHYYTQPLMTFGNPENSSGTVTVKPNSMIEGTDFNYTFI